jgi:hypothetical protein
MLDTLDLLQPIEGGSQADVLDVLRPLIDATIRRLNSKQFLPDPIAGAHFSRIVSVMSSAYKRHGHIIERAILEQLQRHPQFEVWTDALFQVPENADLIANGALRNPLSIIGNEVKYEPGKRTLQVDALVYDRSKRTLRAYEVKRGFGSHDSGKRRSILRDTLCLQVLLKSYGKVRGLHVSEASSHVIFYYGMRSIPAPLGITGAELDSHFGCPVRDVVEQVNGLFRSSLFAILSA